jgi:hypothetical protein
MGDKMNTHVYWIPSPIDDWTGWNRWTALTREPELDRTVAKAILALPHHSFWEDGNARAGEGGPWWTVLPNSDGADPYFLVAFKSESNGNTFIVSPTPLPHLENDESLTVADEDILRGR